MLNGLHDENQCIHDKDCMIKMGEHLFPINRRSRRSGPFGRNALDVIWHNINLCAADCFAGSTCGAC